MLQQLVAGMAIGLAMSAPIGAVNLLVIRTALANGFARAFTASLGAILADLAMAGAVAFGLSVIGEFITDHATALYVIAGAMLVVIGVKAARTHLSQAQLEPLPHAASIGITFMLCVSNPGLYLGYFGAFGAMAALFKRGGQVISPAIIVAGIVMGSALWWACLAWLMSHLSTRLNVKLIERINRWSGVLVAAFGFVLLMQAWS